MTTFEIIRTVIRRQRFIVEATDPGDALMRLTRGEALRSSDTVDTQVIAYERQEPRNRIEAGGSVVNR